MGIESYKHQFAKATLAQWLRDIADYDEYVGIKPVRWRVNRGGPNFGVWTEYPVCLDQKNSLVGLGPVWDESNWDKSEHSGAITPDTYSSIFRDEGSLLSKRPPSYDEVIGLGFTPIAIFDVAVQHKGCIAFAFEVVHRNPVSAQKLEYLKRVNLPWGVYTIDADWILSRVKRPDELVCKRII